jgi:hypothetical protein
MEAEAGESREDGLARGGVAAWLVNVLHADQPDSAVGPGVEPTGEGRGEGA